MSPMNVTKLILLLAATGLSGVVLGYILRWLITLSQKGSMELTIKQTFLDAKSEAQRRIAEAEKESERLLKEAKEKELEEIAGLSRDEARAEIVKSVEREAEEDLAVRMRKLETQAGETLERRAKDILATVIQRLASSSTPEIMSTAVIIPSDDVKGKIIGKEGRNIRAFERMAGVELIVDDTPGAVTISSFDPVRRHIAKAD